MSADQLAGIGGFALSLALSYLPWFGTWFNRQPSETKVAINGALLVVVAGAVYGLACSPAAADLGIVITCDRPGLIGVIGSLLIALGANQAGYVAFVKPFASTTNPA